MDEILATCNGLIFVGDPHLSSKGITSRNDESYLLTCIDKIKQCVDYAISKDAVLIFLGDMFDRYWERSDQLKTLLIRELLRAPYISYVNVGNHDQESDILSDGDSLALICESGNPLVAMRNSMNTGVFIIDGHRIGVCFIPYGKKIPNDVTGLFDDVETVYICTHHDIAFDGGNYPNMITPFAIKGCSKVFNGHVHETKRPIMKGDTIWYNNGSLMRTSVDLANQTPVLSYVRPGHDVELLKIKYNPDAFNVAARRVERMKAGEVQKMFSGLNDMIEDIDSDPMASRDTEQMEKMLTDRIKSGNIKDDVAAMIMAVFRKAIRDGNDGEA